MNSAIIVAALSIQDPRERPQEKQQSADDKHRRFADKTDFFSLFKFCGITFKSNRKF